MGRQTLAGEIRKMMSRAAQVNATTGLGGGVVLSTPPHDLDGAEHTGRSTPGITSEWVVRAGGSVSPVAGTTPLGAVAIQVKTGAGAPIHSALLGTLCWAAVDELLYINTDGSTTWVEAGGEGSASEFMIVAMQPDVGSPPDPIQSPDGFDWLYRAFTPTP